jgi:hypothetical protein
MCFLVTARHILFDETAAKAWLERAQRDADEAEAALAAVPHMGQLHRQCGPQAGSSSAS